MKISELRIGNLVTSNQDFIGSEESTNDTVYEIESINKHSVGFKGRPLCCLYRSIIPIMLTEEVLLRCGFEKQLGKYGHFYLHNVYRGFRLWFCDITKSYQVGRKPSLEEYTNWIKGGLRNLHQLQNIYFELIGKELEVNL